MDGEIKDILLGEFDLSLSQMRIINHVRLHQIERSMHLHGQLHPVVVRQDQGRYQLIDGFKRYYAAGNLLMEQLRCLVLTIELTQAKVLLLSYNRAHQSMEAWEEAMVIHDLRTTHSMDQQTIAKVLGYSRTWVSRRLSMVEKLDERLSSDIMMGVLTSSHVRPLTKVPRGKQTEVARAICQFGMTSRQSEVLVESYLKAKTEEQQHYLLTHPEVVFFSSDNRIEEPYDARLSSWGNNLLQCASGIAVAIYQLDYQLDDQQSGMLNQSEKIIIMNALQDLCKQFKKSTSRITDFHILNNNL